MSTLLIGASVKQMPIYYSCYLLAISYICMLICRVRPFNWGLWYVILWGKICTYSNQEIELAIKTMTKIQAKLKHADCWLLKLHTTFITGCMPKILYWQMTIATFLLHKRLWPYLFDSFLFLLLCVLSIPTYILLLYIVPHNGNPNWLHACCY